MFGLLAVFCLTAQPAFAQEQGETGTQADYIKLFGQGQDAHEKGNFPEALEFYDQAIAAHPDFPEAEYQRAAALISLNRPADAEKSLRRAVELRPQWSLPWASLGSLLLSLGKLPEAETSLNQALKLDPRNYPALTALVELRLQGKPDAASLPPLLDQLKGATTGIRTPASVWAARAAVERALGDRTGAKASAERSLETDPRNVNALLLRAELRADASDYEGAVDDALAAGKISPGASRPLIVLARIYARAGREDDAKKTLDDLTGAAKDSPEAAEIRASMVRCEGTPEALATLEKSLATDPHNVSLLACLGAGYRRVDPARSLGYYKQAADLEPDNLEHAVGFAGALIQARRFDDAVLVLRRVLERAPDNFTAHTSLGTALYELKRFPESLAEFDWIIERKPDLTVTYFFIATANDSIGHYVEALAAYQKFLSMADPAKNQLEIDKVNLRLPTLRKIVERNGTKQRN
jgi:tetratricopeptide (TPR) repeat protein